MDLGFGLIGFGRWGKHHAKAISQTKGAKLVAICAKSEESCMKAKKEFKVDTYQDYKELLKRKDIDIVDIVLPNYLHKQVAIDSLNHGKHVLLEKPMAMSVRECDAILRAVKKNNRILHIGFEMRVSPLWSKIKEIIDNGGIGRPIYVIVELWRGPYRPGSDGWRYDKDRVGSWILEEPVHFLDLVCWYMEEIGDPISVYARANSRGKGDLTENMSFLINFPGGAYAVVNQTLAAYEHHQSVKIVGLKGALYGRWDGPVDEAANPTFQLEYYNGKVVRKVPIKEMAGEAYEIKMEIEAMVNAVKRGKSTYLATGEDGRRAVALCVAGDRSNRLNKIINIPKFNF